MQDAPSQFGRFQLVEVLGAGPPPSDPARRLVAAHPPAQILSERLEEFPGIVFGRSPP